MLACFLQSAASLWECISECGSVNAQQNVCESALYNTCVLCAWLCVCVSPSVFGPLKGSCRAEGEEKITGADIICFCHVDSTSDLTQCGPVQRGRQVDVPAHMLQRHACMQLVMHVRHPCRDDTRARDKVTTATQACTYKVTHREELLIWGTKGVVLLSLLCFRHFKKGEGRYWYLLGLHMHLYVAIMCLFGCVDVRACSFCCVQPCDSTTHHARTPYLHVHIYSTCVCVRCGGGGKDPGSTVSQAASRQAGLSHGPPGESCLLWARAVMIVPAGGDCTCALSTQTRAAKRVCSSAYIHESVQMCS